MDKTNNKAEKIVKFVMEKANGIGDYNWGQDKFEKDVRKMVIQALTSSYEQGQKDILKLANDLTEKPDRAVRYVPLDKLIEAWQSENN